MRNRFGSSRSNWSSSRKSTSRQPKVCGEVYSKITRTGGWRADEVFQLLRQGHVLYADLDVNREVVYVRGLWDALSISKLVGVTDGIEVRIRNCAPEFGVLVQVD